MSKLARYRAYPFLITVVTVLAATEGFLRGG
jgi:hypothetical protein